ncbi:MAG: ASKHA domain-containing protein [Acidimicrobiia bacterium]|nr:MAG: ASKHA domain-containing protein [Acidimicrobiia bacterium]
MTETASVVFAPSGVRHTVAVGSTVLDAAREAGLDLASVCGGRGICGRCQIEVGSAPGIDGPGLSEPGETEQRYRSKRSLATDRRLGCAARILSSVVIEIPPDSRVHHQVIRKRTGTPDIAIDPVVRLYYVEVDVPTLDDPAGERERLAEALLREWQLTDLRFDLHVTGSLHAVLLAGHRAVTVAVHGGSRVTAVRSGFWDRAWGVAFDVGSTTIAGHLCDLATGEMLASAGVMNPQVRFGEDLMSRVSYVMLNENGAERLTLVVRQALDELIGELVEAAGGERGDVLELTLVGNPIMHHLALGFDPTPLGTAPFVLATDGAVCTKAIELGLDVNPGARVYVLPCIAGHVGADAAAAILSEGPQHGEAVQLLVDIGTNAEIVLGSKNRLLAASSPTGPAFEGAQISSGQRAAVGAIERVRIDSDTLEPRYKVIGCDLWSDDPGFAELAPEVTGICGSGIIEVIAELFLAGVIATDGSIRGGDNPRLIADGRTTSYLLHERPIHITQNDVRAIQLAKAALYAGCRLLMDELGVRRVDEIRLAGAFGSYIDTKYAMILGMIPDCDLDRVSAAGNAAGTGAMMALLSSAARREIEQVVREVHKVETAVEPHFQDHFVEAMGIPHSTDRFDELESVVELPAAGVVHRRARRKRKEQ